jgi:RNA polymerase sigma-54 factor
MPDELPLDASWDEIYTAGTPSGTRADYQDDELPVYQGETTQSLQDYLMWQVELTPSPIPIAPLPPPLSMPLMTPAI